MLNNIPRITVCVITYNQEKYIGRALKSLLSQKEYIYEICINDDCSTDSTWDILQSYQVKYPELIKPVRNRKNLGIFQNIEATWERPSGNLVYQLAGDDECGDGYFQRVCEFIISNRIDYKNNSICIYGDYLLKYPDGSSIVRKNDFVAKHKNTLSLSLRELISNRSCVYSINVVNQFVKVSQGNSYIVESAIDRQLQLFSEYNYYIPFIGNIYYVSVGVTTNLTKHPETIYSNEFFVKFIDAKDPGLLNRWDRNYVHFKTMLSEYYRDKAFVRLVKVIWFYVGSINYKYGIRGLQIDRFLNKISHHNGHK